MVVNNDNSGNSPQGSQSDSQLENALTGHGSLPPAGSKLVGLDPLGQALFLARLQQSQEKPGLVVYSHSILARNAIDNFRFFAGEKASERIHFLPALEFDYHRSVLPNSEVIAERNVSLFHALNDPNGRLFVTTPKALLQKAIPSDVFLGVTGIYKTNDEVNRDQLVLNLLKSGYQRQPTAFDPGVFAVRGGVIDIFSPLYSNPIRFEFFGDLIEEIRLFDAKSQRSLDKLEEVYIVPVSLSLIPSPEDLGTLELESLAAKLKNRMDFMGVSKQRREDIFDQLRGGNLSLESAYLYPLLSGGSAFVGEYFPKNTIYVWEGQSELIQTTAKEELAALEVNYNHFVEALVPIADKKDLFCTLSELDETLKQANSYSFETFENKTSHTFSLPNHALSFADERAQTQAKSGHQPSLDAFAKRFRDWMDEGYRVQIVTHTQVHADKVGLLFSPYGIQVVRHSENNIPWPEMSRVEFTQLNVWQGYITESRLYPTLKLVLINEEAIFGQKKRAAKSAAWVAQSDTGRMLSSFRDLKLNDYVVHHDFGIGRYLGLKSLDIQGVPNDYVLLEYRDGDKLYIPVYRLNVLQKYVGGEGASVALDKLGGEAWTKAKKKAEKAIAELAAQFLNLHAKRKLVSAHAYSAPGNEYHQFEMAFPFDETPDQMKAIEDVMHDMGLRHPMDRLVCGDVGYGKTEVAMRAAYRAILDGKQVALLVPTTVLAFQHFESFKTRFENTGARIEMVSRFRGAAETKKILAALKEGKVDIIVGTHRLISNDIVFKDLGLLIVDEEHRFGVVHKERLKEMSAGVHVLSMTATPIPRTLNMAMTGIKEISIITTPPPDRLSVRTFVCRDSDEILIEAIQNELGRDGQVFFVHNRIETIFGVEDRLKKIFPKLKVAVVHGQMEAEELEKKMLGFYHGEYQLLLTTAIIESGLDIPRANTIILDQAHHLGLAQLYQLRGRVGRSSVRAYCYLLTPAESAMTEDAKQRLQVIQRYTDLGSGFNIASHDLEIRGAGDLLGRDQSGHLNAIGVDLYFELLEESIRELRGQEKRITIEPEITMKVAAFFPNDYLPDVGERVALYRKLSGAESEDAIAMVETEIRDRLGTPPEEVANLIGLMLIKLYLKRLHVTRMSCGPKKTSLQFAESTPASPEKLVKLIQSNPKLYSITPDQKFVFNAENSDWRGQLQQIQKLCGLLGITVDN